MIDQTISHYRVLQQVGSGGMGVIYEAEDTRLGRRVALKFLPEAVAADSAVKERFMREARAASALSHPNICTLYDVGEHERRPYIVMELLKGDTLARRISGHALDADTLVDWSIQLTEALEAAHAESIVHRDIKPGNIFITESGRVKVLDFGLAKLAERSTGSSDSAAPTEGRDLTSPGAAVGTVAYMSPEQARGEDVDARTDMFSLGVVMYQMATGRNPFAGKTPATTFDAILNRAPEPAHALNPELPVELDRIVSRGLEKDRALRYQSARDLRAELERARRESSESQAVSVAAPTTSRRTWLVAAAGVAIATLGYGVSRYVATPDAVAIDSVAVLPFVNATGDPDAEYLSDGITESLIHQLSKLHELRVVPRGMVFVYKGRADDLEAVAAELDVAAVVTGRVSERDGRLSVSSELVDVAARSQLWGDQYVGPLEDIFDTREKITREISAALRRELSDEDDARLARRETENAEAYQLYLRSRYQSRKSTREGLTKGIEYAKQAIALDPGYALGYGALAYAYNRLGLGGYVRADDVYPKSKTAIAKALEIDDELPDVHAAAAFVHIFYDLDWDGAERSLDRALELDPDNARAHATYSFWMSAMGRTAEQLDYARRAQTLDPLSPVFATSWAMALLGAGEYEAARLSLRNAIELEPDYVYARAFLPATYIGERRYTEALRVSRELAELYGASNFSRFNFAVSYAAAGRLEQARSYLDGIPEALGFRPLGEAILADVSGDRDEAFEWLNRMPDTSVMILQVMTAPMLASFRDDPRFEALRRRAGLPERPAP